ncbi:MAG: dihydrolipoamide acetyltransferase family protein [Paracoccus sp. (in: a-proteobacteria)]|nr:dihydrolipoamide acetyltransferase family protein [Paracoccus sp. (in: a-proteobacteria)]MDO5648132.1 dihydrolipoamide acetyltransferase family protein [Paracoccus sp. (in: a-proteobacteria)]
MPDIGEGIAEAEIAEWLVAVGDVIEKDTPICAVMTDKATVEIPSQVSGKVLHLGGGVGDTLSVGSELIRLEIDGAGNLSSSAAAKPAAAPAAAAPAPKAAAPAPKPAAAAPAAKPAAKPAAPRAAGRLRPEGEKPLASPSVRNRAREAGIDLRFVRGTGPADRITHDDLDAWIASGGPIPGGASGPAKRDDIEETRVIGLRRKIAERMQAAKRHIPHITIVEEVDVTALEDLRQQLNTDKSRTKLTILPFLMKAMVKAVAEQPALNAHFDDEAGVMRRFGGVHIGIATQTPTGLMVPVVRHAETMTLWDAATEVARVAQAARDGTATRDELSGSTISITSLGALGAISTTPIINRPEVAIVGVNKMMTRPMWDGQGFVPRKVMNLSNSFDHRVIDGWDAAVFVARIKQLLETPALIFVEG